MDTSLSPFDRHYALFMERFPELGFQMPSLSPERSRFCCLAENSLAPLSLDGMQALYFYGIGRGDIYFQVRDWLRSDLSRRLIFLEDDLNVLAGFLHEETAGQILEDPQVFIVHAKNLEGLTQKFPFSRVEVVSSRAKNKRKFHALRMQLLRKTTLAHGLHIDRLYGYQHFDHFVKNIHHLPQSFYANRLKGRFAGVPAIVCGAGPSLQKAMPHLKTIEDKALIIAGGSTLAALSSQGVLPHFGMAVDPNLEEYRRLRNSFAFEVPFLYSTRLIPSVFQTCNGPFGYMRTGVGGILELWIEEELGLCEPLIGDHLTAESLSVTAICLAFAQYIGCNPICLSGVDLAYTDRRRYAAGVSDDAPFDFSQEKDACDRIVKRKDRLGRPIYTAVRWIMESASFSHFAKKHSSISFINTTEGGIGFSKHIPYRSLEETASQFFVHTLDLRRRVQEEIFKASMPAGSEKIIQDKMSELQKSLARIIEQLELLAGVRKGGSIALAEIELGEEMAFPYFFYDIHRLIEREIPAEKRATHKWKFFLDLAKKYQIVLSGK